MTAVDLSVHRSQFTSKCGSFIWKGVCSFCFQVVEVAAAVARGVGRPQSQCIDLHFLFCFAFISAIFAKNMRNASVSTPLSEVNVAVQWGCFYGKESLRLRTCSMQYSQQLWAVRGRGEHWYDVIAKSLQYFQLYWAGRNQSIPSTSHAKVLDKSM